MASADDAQSAAPKMNIADIVKSAQARAATLPLNYDEATEDQRRFGYSKVHGLVDLVVKHLGRLQERQERGKKIADEYDTIQKQLDEAWVAIEEARRPFLAHKTAPVDGFDYHAAYGLRAPAKIQKAPSFRAAGARCSPSHQTKGGS